jgi:hypothetical protein
MITFRNPLWDTMIDFLDKLKDYPNFEIMDGGRYKKRVEQIYNRALERMRLDKSDMDLLSKTFLFLNEKDITSEFTEYMDENVKLGYKCLTTRDGEKIIREAEAVVVKRKQDNEFKKEFEKVEKEFLDAEAKRKAFFDEQTKLSEDYENKLRTFEEMKAAKNQIDSTETKKQETVEAVNVEAGEDK